MEIVPVRCLQGLTRRCVNSIVRVRALLRPCACCCMLCLRVCACSLGVQLTGKVTVLQLVFLAVDQA